MNNKTLLILVISIAAILAVVFFGPPGWSSWIGMGLIAFLGIGAAGMEKNG